jgi:UDP-glucose 4-epimerase
MKILVLGGCGYIGSELYSHFEKDKDNKVLSLDLEWFDNPGIKNVKYNYADVGPKYLEKFDVVIVCAAHSSVNMCIRNTYHAYKNNVYNFVKLLNDIDSKTKLIYMSSSSVYNNKVNAKETERTGALNEYDRGKSDIDSWARFFGKNTYGLRLGTVNGFSRNLRVDLMINNMVYDAMSYGRINMFNPDISRPMLFMEDLCQAVELFVYEDQPPGIYNVHSFNSTVGRIARQVSNVMGVPVDYKGSSSGYNFSMDISKISSIGYKSSVGNAEQIAEKLLERFNDVRVVGRRDEKIQEG